MAIKSMRYLLAGLVLAALPMSSFAFVSVGISVNLAPPPLPVYVQPACPVVGYIWTPGYWAYEDDDYYWVPGTWIAPPEPGFLWTPGYWGFVDGAYLWHAGYWGPHVGFYGGVNYGFGYTGVGFAGGYWRGDAFFYNRAVTNLEGVHVTNVYNTTVVNNVSINRVSYNGGAGGISSRPNAGELAAEHDRHVAFTSAQREQEHMAAGNHDLRASANEGRPRIAATQRAGDFAGRGVIAARSAGGPVHTGESHAGAGPNVRGGPAHEGGPGTARVGEPHGGGAGHAAPVRNEMPARSDRPPGAAGNGGGERFAQNSHERTSQRAGSAEPRAQTHSQPQMHEPQSHAQPQHYHTAEPQGHGSAQVAHEQRAPQQMHEQRAPQQMHEQRPPQQMHEQRAPQAQAQRPQGEPHQARAQPRNEQHQGEPRR